MANSNDASPGPQPDLLVADHYVTHLSEVNKHKDVVSTEDIFNERGVLLLRKGSALNNNAAEKIIKHKLTKPLEQQVTIKDALGRDGLKDKFDKFLIKYPDVKQIHRNLDFEYDFDLILSQWDFHPVLSQKLTVLDQQIPMEFEKGLFAAWLSALLAREMGLDKNAISAVFMAGLTHDTGMMHIDPAIIGKQDTLNAAEWRAIQSHTIIGKLVLENINGLDPRIPRAVMEHHERCDGVGYPAGRTDHQLDVLGQIVGMADSLQAIRIKQFEKLGRNLRDAQPYLHMNSHTYFYATYEAMCLILKKSGLTPTSNNLFNDIKGFSKHLYIQGQALQKVVVDLEILLELLNKLKMGNRGKILANIATHVTRMITSSGLVGEDLLRWLELLQQQPEENIVQELNEIELMFNELKWQLKNTRKAFDAFHEKECDRPECLTLVKIAEEMSQFLDTVPINKIFALEK